MANPLSDTANKTALRGISIAQLSTISLAKLHQRDPAELALLDSASSNTGFFYLDFRGDAQGNSVLAHLPNVYTAVEKYFDQPNEAKAKDTRLDIKASQDLGWKMGRGGESFELSRDEVALNGASISKMPRLFRDGGAKISDFMAGCDEACLTLLNSLSEDFMLHHRVDQPSDTGLKFVLHPSLARLSEVGESLHTDSGTLTLLFYHDWSLHAFLPDAGIWGFLPPPAEGCALVNVANTLQRLSGGKLHSPKHRVTQPFDGAQNRYFLSYFLRPENELLEKWGSAN
ncbi:Uncharacterized protein BP5553_06740 [Venustampulla echinocandica]|uniref:Isopenicillin N synthase-like Fe(2+) 2OG dioxygenase domain-containing protein n=1 Tax=Venustampulla echinocandica TaxID=2656787 RepID=A0A370TKS2_9HELO|nr:Uncharacterized protein BP5553_06740 [Venustampulla echinocandica]RDL36128.1 Uncharacterized protein BP5553_06740 [Venustampulla echinocandica]